MGDKSINQQDRETASRQLNEGKGLANTSYESILSDMNTEVDNNPEVMKNLETAESTRRSTQTQITTKPAEEVI